MGAADPTIARREDCPDINSLGGLVVREDGRDGKAEELGAGGLVLPDRLGRGRFDDDSTAADGDHGVTFEGKLLAVDSVAVVRVVRCTGRGPGAEDAA